MIAFRTLATATTLAVALLTTLPACQQTERIPGVQRPAHPMVDGLPNGRTRGTVELPTIDLTGNTVAWTTFEPTIIDTRTFPQPATQGAPWNGDTRRPGRLLPPHSRDKTLPEGPTNDLTSGGLLDRGRVDAGPLFPAIYQTPWTPPDPSIAVGPNNVVVSVNMAIAIYDRAGNEQFFSNLDSTGDPGFFEEVGAGDFTFDPKCFYDPAIERFVILALEVYNNPDEGWMTIAISDDSDPNGIWYKYRTWAVITDEGREYWPDYPGLGFDDNAFYVTANMFGFQSGFAGVLFRAFPKAPMLDGDPVTVIDVRDPNGASAQVAQCLDSRDTPLFVSRRSSSRLRLQAIEDPLGTPNLVTVDVDVPEYQGPSGDAPNLNGGELDTLDGRIMNVMWRDSGLWTAHAVRGTGGNTKSRWYHFDMSGFPGGGTPSLIESGDIDLGSGTYSFFPAIAANRFGDAAMVFARSNAQEYASIQATGRRAGDPAGTMGLPIQLAIGDAGTNGRWGDYFDITVDPTDDSTFWLVGEYATTFNGEVGWQTWVGTLEVSCPADVNGDDVVNVNDILAILAAYGSNNPDGDANGDGTVNVNDVLIVISSWGNCPGNP